MTVAGFTGTQSGMTEKQFLALTDILNNEKVSILHHGDCIGADSRADQLSKILNIETIIHPPSNDSKRAFCENYIKILPIKDYIARNHDIVDEAEILIATPKESKPKLRSGTWATIRYAIKSNKPVFVIYPDGTVVDGNSFS